MKKLRIGFIGNFQVPYTTENDRKWSFEKLGHEVIPLQENQITAKELLMRLPEFDLLIYSHTHGWEIKDLKQVFYACKQLKIPTVSVHLDRWAWLGRETDIGKEATWFTEYQFMADFSPEAQALYKKHNLNAYYLKPGVVERDCYMAKPDKSRFPHDIIFVGSKGYHPEYPERPALISFLERTYGDRFGHYGNDGLGVVRGDDLNVLYATAKVVVGDSCFGGRPNYWSDRVPETIGRGGFLLHPKVEGLDIRGIPYLEQPRNLDMTKYAIDSFLDPENEAARLKMREDAFNWVKEHETYTNRSREMLDVIFKGGELNNE